MEGGEAQVNCEGLEVVLQEFLPFPDPAGIATVIHSRCGMPGLSGQTLLYLEGMENVVPDLLGSMETPSTPGVTSREHLNLLWMCWKLRLCIRKSIPGLDEVACVSLQCSYGGFIVKILLSE